MQTLRLLLKYITAYNKAVWGNIFSNILMAIFTVVSVPAIIPLFQILFNQTEAEKLQQPDHFGTDNVLENLKYQFQEFAEVHDKQTVVFWICLGLVTVFLLKNLFRYLSLFFMAIVRNGTVRDLRQQLYKKILSLPVSFFTEERKGDLISRMSSDVQEVEWSILNVLETIFREPIILVGSLGFMIYLSPSLTGLVFLVLIVAGLLIVGLSKSLRKNSAIAQEKLGSLISTVEETLSGLKVIKSFNAEPFLYRAFSRLNNSYRDILTKLLRRRDLSSPLSEFLGIVAVTVLLFFGAMRVLKGELAPEDFFVFLFAFYNVITPAKNFANAYYNIQKGAAALDRIMEILHADNAVPDGVEHAEKLHFEREIEFRNVWFKYPNQNDWVLKDISFVLPKGQMFALVGSSGAGKTTIADLIARFYDVSQGQILIDGIDIRQIPITDLRNLISMVSQDPVLFNDSIYNNISFGWKDSDVTAIIEAAKIANAWEFIQVLPNGLDSNIGDRGSKLSGGQRQRLTIARAVLRNPAILILDEATSALDTVSEKLVQEALDRVLKNRSSLVIAHRLTTVQAADKILVLDQGQIMESGTHDELILKDGLYRHLVSLQTNKRFE